MEDHGRVTAITMSCSYRSRLIRSWRVRGPRCPSSCGLLGSLRLSTGLRLAISHDWAMVAGWGLSREEKILIPPRLFASVASQGDCTKITLTLVGRVQWLRGLVECSEWTSRTCLGSRCWWDGSAVRRCWITKLLHNSHACSWRYARLASSDNPADDSAKARKEFTYLASLHTRSSYFQHCDVVSCTPDRKTSLPEGKLK